MKLIFSPCSFIYYLFYHGIQSLVWPKWSTMADSNIFSLLFRIPFFLLCFSQFDQWKAWWLQFSVMTTADWTGDQITLVSMFHCKSCDPTMVPRRCQDRNWKENLAYEVWEQQDQVLLTWLQSTLSMSILTLCLGSILLGYRLRKCMKEGHMASIRGSQSSSQSSQNQVRQLTKISYSLVVSLVTV